MPVNLAATDGIVTKKRSRLYGRDGLFSLRPVLVKIVESNSDTSHTSLGWEPHMWNAQPAPETSEQTQRQSQLAKPAPVTDDKRTMAWIGKSVVFKGELTSAEDMRIEGTH